MLREDGQGSIAAGRRPTLETLYRTPVRVEQY